MDKNVFKDRLNDKDFAGAVLVYLAGFQTNEERARYSTVERNNVGFNAYDAAFLTSLAEWYQEKGFLTPKQHEMAKKALLKYWRQVPDYIGAAPKPERKPEPKPTVTVRPTATAAPKPEPKPAVNGNGNGKTARVQGGLIEVRFPYDAKLVEKVRLMVGRRWLPDKKVWTVHNVPANRSALQSLGFRLEDADVEASAPAAAPAKKDAPLKNLKTPLMPFQVEGVHFLDSRDGTALIADEMGLGKTAQALGWLAQHPEKRPACVVVPASLKINWSREVQKFMATKEKVVILQGTKPRPIEKDATIIIINYDILAYWLNALKALRPSVVILDECHYIKNRSAQRTKASMALAKSARHVIALSGTPVVNRPVEFYNTLHLLQPDVFGSWWKFTQRYCDRYHDGFGWNVKGASNTEELHQLLTSTVMLRRIKADVLEDLPAKVRSVIPIELNNRAEYDKAERDFTNWVKENFGAKKASAAMNAEALTRVTYLKRLAAKGKMDQAIEWIKDYLDANGKLVVFAVHKDVIDRLMNELRDFRPVKVDGSVVAEARQAAVDRFQTDPACRVFIGNIKAAGVGLTLTAASATAFVELAWTPGDHDQAEDRVHRIGQRESVTAYYLVAERTVEDYIAALIDEKRRVLYAVLDGKETDESSMLSALLQRFSEEK